MHYLGLRGILKTNLLEKGGSNYMIQVLWLRLYVIALRLSVSYRQGISEWHSLETEAHRTVSQFQLHALNHLRKYKIKSQDKNRDHGDYILVFLCLDTKSFYHRCISNWSHNRYSLQYYTACKISYSREL